MKKELDVLEEPEGLIYCAKEMLSDLPLKEISGKAKDLYDILSICHLFTYFDYRAFLPAISHPNEQDILSAPFPFTSSNPIVNLKGQLLFTSWDNMLETGGLVTSGAPIFSFDGQDIAQKR